MPCTSCSSSASRRSSSCSDCRSAPPAFIFAIASVIGLIAKRAVNPAIGIRNIMQPSTIAVSATRSTGSTFIESSCEYCTGATAASRMVQQVRGGVNDDVSFQRELSRALTAAPARGA
jgi:hypothetical protein